MLAALILVLIAGGLLAWQAERYAADAPRWIALAALVVDGALLVSYFAGGFPDAGVWLDDVHWRWIPRFGIGFHLALDGVSLLLAALTIFLGVMAVAASWTEIKARVGFFHFHLLWTLAGVMGVFLALDLFLFFVFWEIMIVPMYFLIALWGHEDRAYAAIKFFLFTQVSGLLMLLAIVVLVVIHHGNTGVYTFDYFDLLKTNLDVAAALWLMLGFFIAFTVKLPGVPFHTWLPDAHTQAPTGGSVILAGVMLKTGAYGLLRFVIPLFPEVVADFSPVAMGLGVAGILYGGALAFAQSDIKRLVAYTSISHMGFVLVGLFAWNALALQGVVITLLAHGISAAALFALAGALQERIHTRDMNRMGGLWTDVPRMAAIGLFFSIAALGMPGLGNFVGEFLVLLGAYRADAAVTAAAALGLIIAPVYSLILIQRAFHGEPREKHPMRDFGAREMALMGALIAATVWIGVYPQSMLGVSEAWSKSSLSVWEDGVARQSHSRLDSISLLSGGKP
ncbi:NADH-quinone oxidoreductase subunit M [Methylocaldum sp. MU1018]